MVQGVVGMVRVVCVIEGWRMGRGLTGAVAAGVVVVVLLGVVIMVVWWYGRGPEVLVGE